MSESSDTSKLLEELELFATGMNPGFQLERLALLATSISNGVEQIAVTEFLNLEHMPGAADMLTGFGFGLMETSPQAVDAVVRTTENYLLQPLHFAADKTGCTIDRIEREDLHVKAPSRIVVPGLMTIEPDTVGHVRFRWTAYCADKPFLVLEVNWYLTDAMRPPESQSESDDFWIVQVEGRPSVRIKLELAASWKDQQVRHHPDNPVEVSMLGVVIPAIQAIPAVVDAEAGIMITQAPQPFWKSDMRLPM